MERLYRETLLVIFMLCVLVAVVSDQYWWGGILAVMLSLLFALYSFAKIAHMSNPGGTLGRMAISVQGFLIKVGFK